MIRQLIDLAKKEGITCKNEDEYRKSLPLMKLQLKALIARDLWNTSEYYQIINEANLSVKKALNLLKEKEFDQLFIKNDRPVGR